MGSKLTKQTEITYKKLGFKHHRVPSARFRQTFYFGDTR